MGLCCAGREHGVRSWGGVAWRVSGWDRGGTCTCCIYHRTWYIFGTCVCVCVCVFFSAHCVYSVCVSVSLSLARSRARARALSLCLSLSLLLKLMTPYVVAPHSTLCRCTTLHSMSLHHTPLLHLHSARGIYCRIPRFTLRMESNMNCVISIRHMDCVIPQDMTHIRHIATIPHHVWV